MSNDSIDLTGYSPPPRAITTFADNTVAATPAIKQLLDAGIAVIPDMYQWSPQKLLFKLFVATVVDRLVTTDVRMQMAKDMAVALKDAPGCTLIHGPTGSGKELIARIIHGQRPAEEFMSVNCAGIPEMLFESELFGHVRGAFTGANSDRVGKLAAVGTGTVFLDEVGDLPMSQQAKLLLAIQERRVTPVGSNVPVPITCRMVFATNKDLQAMYRNLDRDGKPDPKFRVDLYFRIAQVVIRTTPLSERRGDIPIIIAEISRRNGWDMPTEEELIYAPDCREGNVRELENWLYRRQYRVNDEDYGPNLATNNN